MKKALITGITGQDGSYLAQLLVDKGYEVHGIARRTSTNNHQRIQELVRTKKITVHYGDLTDSASLIRILAKINPDELYNLAAQSHVAVSFEVPVYTAEVNALGILHILEAVRILGLTHHTKIYQASSSELFGKVQETPQKETTPFYPRSPYAVAKLFAYWTIINYREAYNMFACNGILFNHESPVRGEEFVTRKIARGLVRIKAGLQETLTLGNLEARRDWGFAGDYVEAMWLMLQQETPDDFVIATGISYSVRDFVTAAAKELDLPIVWCGSGLEEQAVDAATGNPLITIDPALFRPTEVDFLLGDAHKAHRVLQWQPKTNFTALVKTMVEQELNDLTLARGVHHENKQRSFYHCR